MNAKQLKIDFNQDKISKPDFISQMHDQHKILFDYSEFIKDTDIAKIEITDGRVIMTSREHGIKMICDPDDHRIAPIEILNFGDYENDDSKMLLNLIQKENNVLDVGGNYGWYTIAFAKEACANVHSFEPIPKTFAYLKENLAINNLDSVELHNFGFSDQEHDLTFYYYPEGSVNASSANISDHENPEKVVCHVRKMDDFTKEKNIKIDFIKCDVEGAELLVFKGGIETLKRDKPIVFAELLRKWSAKFNYHPNEVIQLFRSLGYDCYTVNKGTLNLFEMVDEETIETNFFFLDKEKHSELINLYT